MKSYKKKHSKKTNLRVILIISIVTFLVVISSVFLFYVKQEVFNIQPLSYTQYVGECTDLYGYSPWSSYNKSGMITFKFDYDEYKFLVNYSGQNLPQPYHCEETIIVRKNNIDIDNLNWRTPNSSIYKINDYINLTVTSITNNLCYNAQTGTCTGISNDYTLSFNNLYVITTTTNKNIYLLNETPIIHLNVKNNLNKNCSGVLNLKYNILTIDGVDGYLDIYNISLSNNYSFTLTTPNKVSSIKIQPTIKDINCYFDGVSGLNNFNPNIKINDIVTNNLSIDIISNQTLTSRSEYYRLSNNNCSSILLYSNEITTNDYLTLLECSNHINTTQTNQSTNQTIQNNTQINNQTTNYTSTNQTTQTNNQTINLTCYKITTFIPQISFGDLISKPCYSYNTISNCGSNFYNEDECLNYYNSLSIMIRTWNGYGFLLSIIVSILSIIMFIIYMSKYFRKKK